MKNIHVMKTKKKNDLQQREQSVDADLPGYPHYPVKDDILNREERIDADIEDMPASDSMRKNLKDQKVKSINKNKSTTNDFVKGTSADVTKNDLINLGPEGGDLDMGDDELFMDDIFIGPDLSGDDLDVPGAELDDDQEDIGSEDEENNYYSRGQS
jgi:hypothetical protein